MTKHNLYDTLLKPETELKVLTFSPNLPCNILENTDHVWCHKPWKVEVHQEAMLLPTRVPCLRPGCFSFVYFQAQSLLPPCPRQEWGTLRQGPGVAGVHWLPARPADPLVYCRETRAVQHGYFLKTFYFSKVYIYNDSMIGTDVESLKRGGLCDFPPAMEYLI